VRATSGSGDGSPQLEGSFDIQNNATQRSRDIKAEIEVEAEAEAEGLTSSEEGEGEGEGEGQAEVDSHPMELAEGPSICFDDNCSGRRDTGTEKDRDDDSSSSGSSLRVKSRGKQHQPGGETSSLSAVPMGSAAEGMKAFWGAIHDTSSSAKSPSPSSSSSTALAPSHAAFATSQAVEGSSVAATLKEKSGDFMVDDEVEDGSGDEARDLWDENGEILHEESGSKKRFRRHTIAY
jgi:hypothetical protein